MPSREFRPFKPPARAFTLIELLVSMTVLAVIVFLISQLVSSATSITVGNRQRLDADGQARLVFDRMAFDIGKMLKRPDVDYIFARISGGTASSGGTSPGVNDKMFFFSEAPAFFNGDPAKTSTRSSVSLIGYRINAIFQLERLGKALTWDNPVPAATPGGITFLSPGVGINPDPASTLSGNWASTIGLPPDYSPAADDADYHVLAEQVCRLEICFQLTNGTFSPLPVLVTNPSAVINKLDAGTGPTMLDDASKGYAVGSRWYDMLNSRPYVCVNNAANAAAWNFLGMKDVRAVVVALAILDNTSARSVSTLQKTVNGQIRVVPDLSSLVSLFADANIKDIVSPGSASADLSVPSFPLVNPPVPARLMAEAWGTRMKQADFVTKSGLSKPAAAQVRIYQRSFLLNSP